MTMSPFTGDTAISAGEEGHTHMAECSSALSTLGSRDLLG